MNCGFYKIMVIDYNWIIERRVTTQVTAGGRTHLSSWFDLNMDGIDLCDTRIGLQFYILQYFTAKGNFPKNMGFGAFFGNIYIIKAWYTKKSQLGILALILDQFFTCQASYLGKT